MEKPINQIYIIKNLSFWMVDELNVFSKYVKFKIIFLRKPGFFIKDEIVFLEKKGIQVLILNNSNYFSIQKALFSFWFLMKNINKLSFDYNGILVIKSIYWFNKLDLSIFQDKANIHAQFASQAALISLMVKNFLKRTDIKFSFTFHAHDIYFGNRWLELLIKESFKNFSISQYNIDYIKEKYNINPAKTVLSRLGVFHDHTTKRVKNVYFTIGFLSWFQEKKGLIYLVQAVTHIIKNHDNKIRLFLAGDGPVKDQVLLFVKENQLEHNIFYLGKIKGEEKALFFQNIELFVLPAISLPKDIDGLPVVLMEAISYGLPLISTKVTGIPEICIDKYNGILVNERSIPELIDSILLMKNNELLRQQYGDHSLIVSKQYDIELNSIAKLKELEWV